MLLIDSDGVSAPIRCDAAEPGGEEFPHSYGLLPVTAVTDILRVSRDASGQLVLPR